jgi:hypothetical protein
MHSLARKSAVLYAALTRMIALAGLLSCSRSPGGSAASTSDAGPLTVLAVPELGIRIGVPLGAHVERSPDLVLVELNPEARSGRTLTLSRAATSRIPYAGATTRVLPHGGQLAYTIRRENVGSGGPEVDLAGSLHVGSAILLMRCSAQGDELFGPPDPTWCLPLLDAIADAPVDGGASRDD